MAKQTKSEAKRCKYLTALQQTGDMKKAASASGLRGKHTKRRIYERLKNTHTLADRPRSGRPRKYSATQFEAALHIIQHEHVDSKRLVGKLVAAGYLDPRSDVRTFMCRFKEWCQQQGISLTVGATKTTFTSKETDKPQRVKFCKDMLEVIKHQGLKGVMFEDEIALEESPHPKGKFLAHMLHPSSSCVHT